MQSGYDIDSLYQEAQTRWLKPPEVHYILQNHEKYKLTHEPPQKPPSGSLFLFNKRVLRFFRRDGHSWRKKKDGRTVGEAHERLKVGNVEALNCYYAHGEQNPTFQRRSYWMLDPPYEYIVLVHYRDTSEVKASSTSAQLSLGASSNLSPNPSSCSSQNPGYNPIISDSYEPHQNLSSPGSVEVNSEISIKNNEMDHLDGVDRTGEFGSTAGLEVSQALKRLAEQLSLDEDSLQEIGPFASQDENSSEFRVLEYEKEIFQQDQYTGLQHEPEHIVHDKYYGGYAGMPDSTKNLAPYQDAGDNGEHHQEQKNMDGSKEPLYWTEMLESYKSSSGSMLLPQEVKDVNFPTHASAIENHENSAAYHTILCDQSQMEMPLESNLSLTIAQRQKFSIQEISPEWGHATEVTKVIIVGSFLCDPSESTWTCMFGDIEVPLQIIQEGVIRCEAPVHPPGKVTLCITSGNRESCSEIREFEYQAKTTSCTHCNLTQTDATKSPEELLLLVGFVQLLLSDPSMQKGDNTESGIHLLRKLKANDDLWGHVIEAILLGSGTSSDIADWLLQELLKDKLQQWLSIISSEGRNHSGCSLSKKEQGIIHMAAGLGFEWALNPIISYGVSINFRDINGWTALHWAARFGREKMVAALIASGASAGAVTDPSSQDPTGRTPASIAAINGHKGLAGYLSEIALTSHLSSLTLEESELYKGSAEVEAEIRVNSISTGSLVPNEDQLSLKDTLAAVRNSAQAAARIQSAFRAHSFRKRQQREAAAAAAGIDDEYGINSNDIKGLSAMSKVAFGNVRDYNSAALSIQKKYRGWKGRKDFLALRQKIVKIQAHVRGYQVRKQYKVICWAVGILDKVVLRWRRKGVGLRGFRHETDSIGESDSEDEDILKIFRRQKVDAAIDEAVSRVLSMVESPEARQQYSRMLERYRQAKAELGDTSEAATSTSIGGVSDLENSDMFQIP